MDCSSEMVFSEVEGDKEAMGSPIPLCTVSPKPAYRFTPDWVLREFEEQFKTLLITVEAGRFMALKSAIKWDRELNRLQSSINYDNNEGSLGRDRLKGRGAWSSYEA